MAGKNKFTPLQQIRGWTCEDVQRALTKNDLQTCCDAVAKRNIDGEALLNLTEGKLVLWKNDLKQTEIQKLSSFVVNVNFYPEKYSSSAGGLRQGGNVPAKTWGQNANQSTSSSSFGRSTPTPPSKPTPGLRSAGSSNGFNAPTAQATNKFSKPTPPNNFNKPPPNNFNKPAPPNNFNKSAPPNNFNKPSPNNFTKPAPPNNFNKPPPNNFNKPAPPNNFNKPNPQNNFNKPPPNNFNKPTPPNNFNKPPPNNFNKPPPNNFNKPAPPNNFNKPNPQNILRKQNPPYIATKNAASSSRLYPTAGGTRSTPQQSLQVDQRDQQNEYLAMEGKSPVAPKTPVLEPTNKFTRPVPEPPRESVYSPPALLRSEYPISNYDEDEQPEYHNIDETTNTAEAYPPADPDNYHSDAESWGTDFDDADEEDIDFPPEELSANKSSLFRDEGPSLPHRPPNREPVLPARPTFQPPSAFQPPLAFQPPSAFKVSKAFDYPQPPAAMDNNMLSGLIGDDQPEYADDEEYSLIDEFSNLPPPALVPREYPSKPASIQVPEAMAPRVPHREPVLILPRNLPSHFGESKLPDSLSLKPHLPRREPYKPPKGREETNPEAFDDCEYEVIEHREGDNDYLAPTGMKRAASTESVGSPSALTVKLREALHARKISLTTTVRPEIPPMPHEFGRAKTPTLESKPFPKPPPVDRPFSNGQPQRPLPPPPEPERRPSTGTGPQNLKTKQWYHDVDRRRGEEMLKYGENGSFLLRPSARTANPLTLTLWYDNRIYNIGVRLREDQRYALGTEKAMERSFGSVDELVTFYQRESLMLFSGGEKSGSTMLTETPGRRYMSH